MSEYLHHIAITSPPNAYPPDFRVAIACRVHVSHEQAGYAVIRIYPIENADPAGLITEPAVLGALNVALQSTDNPELSATLHWREQFWIFLNEDVVSTLHAIAELSMVMAGQPSRITPCSSKSSTPITDQPTSAT